jgi:hypothetical protein
MGDTEDRIPGETGYIMAYRVAVTDPDDPDRCVTIAAFIDEGEAWNYASTYAADHPDDAENIIVQSIGVRGPDDHGK